MVESNRFWWCLQRFVALLGQRMNQIADQGFHATHNLHAGRSAETNLIERQS